MRRLIYLALVMGMLAVPLTLTAAGDQAFLGVRFSNNPLPQLVKEHLNIDSGLEVLNIAKGSPANLAGIERYDIITAFDGKPISSSQQLVDAIRSAGAASHVKIGLIHKGKPIEVSVQLACVDDDPAFTSPQWVYPSDVQEYDIWQPRGWMMKPRGQDDWMSIDIDDFPMISGFQSRIIYRHNENGRNITIKIMGDPNQVDTKLVVTDGAKVYDITVGDLKPLPDDLREIVEKDLEKAKDVKVSAHSQTGFDIDEHTRQMLEHLNRVKDQHGANPAHRDQVLQHLKNLRDSMGQGYVRSSQSRVIRRNINGSKYSLEISGDPADPQTDIIVTSDSDEYKLKIADIEKLPEGLRKQVKQDIESSGSTRIYSVPGMDFDIDIDWPGVDMPGMDFNMPDMDAVHKQLQEAMENLRTHGRMMDDHMKLHQQQLDKLGGSGEKVTMRSKISRSVNGNTYSLEVLGNPSDPQTELVVTSGKDNWKIKVAEVDSLPEDVVKEVKADLERLGGSVIIEKNHPASPEKIDQPKVREDAPQTLI